MTKKQIAELLTLLRQLADDMHKLSRVSDQQSQAMASAFVFATESAASCKRAAASTCAAAPFDPQALSPTSRSQD